MLSNLPVSANGLVSTLDYARFSQPYFGSLLEERSLCLISDFVDSFIVVDGLLKNWWIQCCFQNRLILSDLTMPIPPLDKQARKPRSYASPKLCPLNH